MANFIDTSTGKDASQLHLTANPHHYVTVIDGSRKGFLLGPYTNEADAIANIKRGKDLAIEHNHDAVWYSFGHASSTRIINTVFGN